MTTNEWVMVPREPTRNKVKRQTVHDPLTHELKVWPQFFKALVAGTKTFEVRMDDRGFAVGDTLRLREFIPGGDYTGREVSRVVSDILRGGDFGVEPGYVVLALAAAPSAPAHPQDLLGLPALLVELREAAAEMARSADACATIPSLRGVAAGNEKIARLLRTSIAAIELQSAAIASAEARAGGASSQPKPVPTLDREKVAHTVCEFMGWSEAGPALEDAKALADRIISLMEKGE